MNNYYDKKHVFCTHCKHEWILLSNITIDTCLYTAWLIKVYEQHKYLFPEGGFNEEKY